MKQSLLVILLFSCLGSAIGQDYRAEYESLNVRFWANFNSNMDSLPIILGLQKEAARRAENDTLIGDNLHNYAGYWSRIPNRSDSMIYYSSLAFESYEKIPDYNRMANAKRVIGSSYKLLGEMDEAEKALKEALKWSIKSGEKKRMIYSISELGALKSNEGNDVKALEYYQRALEIQESIKDTSLRYKYNVKGKMGLLYSHKKDYGKAIELMETYISELAYIEDYWQMAQWTNNLTNTYILSGDTATARLKCFEAIQYGREASFKYAVASAYVNLTNIYLKGGNLDSAAYYLNQINVEIPVIEEVDFAAIVAETQGTFYVENKEYSKSLQSFQKAFDTWEQTNTFHKLVPLSKSMAEANEALGNYKEALHYQELYKAYSDSTFNQEKIEDFKELEMSYGFDQKILADSLANLKSMQALDLVYQKNIAEEQRSKNFLIFGLLLVIVVVFFVFMAYRRNKKQKELLNQKNVKIEEALAQNQLLLKEVHHRVKNNFQIVSSLLELQSKGIEDSKALELAKEGQSRVRSMAMIHQRLYQNDDFLIDFSDYLGKLIGDIARTYEKNETLKLEIDGGNFSFDIDTAIPLGLIVNELVTNAFKYGFKADLRFLRIALRKEKVGDYYCLEVTDNGTNIPEDLNIQKTKSLGLRLVKRLSKQLHGTVSFERTPQSTFSVRFKDTEHRLLID